MASEPCALGCGNPVSPHDQQTWKEVKGWVGGPKKDSMRAREETGRYAHHHCVLMLQDGQDPATQPTLFRNPVVGIDLRTGENIVVEKDYDLSPEEEEFLS